MWFLSLLLIVIGVLWIALRKGFGRGVSPGVFLVISFSLLFFLVILYFHRGAEHPDMALLTEGEVIDLSGRFTDLDGRPVSLEEYRGKVLFLNLWATWCPPCRREMPAMAGLYERFSRQGLSMVAVSNEDRETVREFLEKNSYPFTILLDTEDVLARRFAVRAIPTTLVMDSNDRLLLSHVGYRDWNSPEMREVFSRWLAP
jgi:thiol-disulfide isomerase/thioredoxin